MAQGGIKKAPKAAPAAKNTNRQQKGTRVIKAKKGSALKSQQFKKKHSSGIAELTERSLASKAGHLELLRGGKKDRKLEKEKAAAQQVKKK